MPSSRPLIIPQKRALFPPRTNSISPQTRTYQLLNPSAVAAETCIKEPRNPEPEDEPASHPGSGDDGSSNLTRIEFDFAAPPQPFLDPPAWEAMLKRSRTKSSSGEENRAGGAGEGEGEGRASGGSETPQDQRVRREREAEYNSLAIRGRSSISGRGKRGRGVGRGGYWGGRQ